MLCEHTATKYTLSFPLTTLVSGDLLGAVIEAVAEDKEARAARCGGLVARCRAPWTNLTTFWQNRREGKKERLAELRSTGAVLNLVLSSSDLVLFDTVRASSQFTAPSAVWACPGRHGVALLRLCGLRGRPARALGAFGYL